MRSSSARRDASDAMCKWTSSSDGAVGVSQFEVPNPAPTLVRSAADFDLSFFDDLFRLSGDWKKPLDFFFSLVVGELVSACLPGVELRPANRSICLIAHNNISFEKTSCYEH